MDPYLKAEIFQNIHTLCSYNEARAQEQKKDLLWELSEKNIFKKDITEHHNFTYVGAHHDIETPLFFGFKKIHLVDGTYRYDHISAPIFLKLASYGSIKNITRPTDTMETISVEIDRKLYEIYLHSFVVGDLKFAQRINAPIQPIDWNIGVLFSCMMPSSEWLYDCQLMKKIVSGGFVCHNFGNDRQCRFENNFWLHNHFSFHPLTKGDTENITLVQKN